MKAPKPMAGMIMIILLLMPAIALANNSTGQATPPVPPRVPGPTFGLGEEPAAAAPMIVRRTSGPTFGLGNAITVSTVQDCPGGVCPLPTGRIVTRQVVRQPIVMPQRTVTRTVTDIQPTVGLCPGGVCPLPQAASITVSQPLSGPCPNCPCPNCPMGGEVWTPVGPPRVVSTTYGTPYVVGVASCTPQRSVVMTSTCPSCPQPTRVIVNDCPTCPQPTRTVTRTRTVSRPVAARWTWPGSLDRHLSGPPHNIPPWELAQMTYAEKVARHDADHDGGVGRSGRPRVFPRLAARLGR